MCSQTKMASVSAPKPVKIQSMAGLAALGMHKPEGQKDTSGHYQL